MEETKGSQVQLGESAVMGTVRVPLTESKPLKESSQSLSPVYPTASGRNNSNEKGSPLVIVASHKRALQNA